MKKKNIVLSKIWLPVAMQFFPLRNFSTRKHLFTDEATLSKTAPFHLRQKEKEKKLEKCCYRKQRKLFHQFLFYLTCRTLQLNWISSKNWRDEKEQRKSHEKNKRKQKQCNQLTKSSANRHTKWIDFYRVPATLLFTQFTICLLLNKRRVNRVSEKSATPSSSMHLRLRLKR